MAEGSDHEVSQADQNDIYSQLSLFFTDLDELLSEYEQHRSTCDIAIMENLTVWKNAVRALQNVSHFVSQTNKEAVLEMARNFLLMFWDCHCRCEFPSRTRCSQDAVLSLSSPNRVDTRQVGRPKLDIKEETLVELRSLGLAGRTSLVCYSSHTGLFTAGCQSLALPTCPVSVTSLMNNWTAKSVLF